MPQSLVIFLVCLAPAFAEKTETSDRKFVPFLSRDAVVRASDEMVTLSGMKADGKKIQPLLVIGEAKAGPRKAWHQRQLATAATTLKQYLEKCTGVTTFVMRGQRKSNVTGPRISLHTQGEDGPEKSFPELAEADDHGFLIRVRSVDAPWGIELHIVGRSAVGTRYGVWFFLMNYAGLRVLMPGEVGEVFERKPLEVPKELYVLNPGPDFRLRIWSGAGGMEQSAWLSDFGGSQRFQYHHNMHRIYPPKKFGQTHPEYFPVVKGKHTPPPPEKHSAWQPTFSVPATAQRAIEYADEMFRAQPSLKSISLTVNDGLGYSEKDLLKGTRLEDGRVSISEVYYRYVNKVARGIRAKWPARYVALLPYNRVAEPPSFPLEDNVVVFLFREPKASYQRWKGKAKHFGVYQWLYGAGYLLPNHWPRAMHDYLLFMRSIGAIAFKGEAYVAWAQGGPKMWVLCNLLWNVDADVDALLDDYYRHAYGPAANAMACYFARAEEIYERRRKKDEFLMATWNPLDGQFEHVTREDYRVMGTAIGEAEKAVAEAAKPIQKRVEFTVTAFEWGRRYWLQFDLLKALGKAEVNSEQESETTLRHAVGFHETGQGTESFFTDRVAPSAQYSIFSRQKDKVEKFQKNRHVPKFRWPNYQAALDHSFGAVTAFKLKLQTPEKVAQFWEEFGHRHWPLLPEAKLQQLQLLHPKAVLKTLLTNSSFEEPADPKSEKPEAAKGWKIYHNRMVNAEVFTDSEVAHTGKSSLAARGLTDYSGVITWVVVPVGRLRLSFWYKTTDEVRHGVASIAGGRIRGEFPPARKWTRYEMTFNRTNNGNPKIHFNLILALRHGGSPKSQIWFDDVRLELMAPEGRE